MCLAQDAEQARRLCRLGAENVVAIGDLKAAGHRLPVDQAQLQRLKREIGRRPLWLAASTHQDEEEAAAEVHATLAAKYPGLLTIIAPRHPVARRRRCGDAGSERVAGRATQSWRADYAAKPTSISPIPWANSDCSTVSPRSPLSVVRSCGTGVTTLFEAARLDCAILHGPDISNCAAMAAALADAGAAQMVIDAEELGHCGIAAAVRSPAVRRSPGRGNARCSAGRGDSRCRAGAAGALARPDRTAAERVTRRRSDCS